MPKDMKIKTVLLIGSGPIIIGQAAEFDYAGTQACRVLKEEGVRVVLVNSNPATIMTDKDMADSVYLEPLNRETVERIIEKEQPDALLAGLGGQTGLTIAMQLLDEGFLASHHVRLIGVNGDAIHKAEDRQMFKDTMLSIGQPVIPSQTVTVVSDALKAAEEIGYPVIVRPAFTLGGGGGGVAATPEQLKQAAKTGLDASPITQILVERYIYGWKEIEFEVMRDHKGNVITVCSMENVDPVGVHTGDSIVVAPTLTLSDKEYQMLRSASLNIITALGIEGGCNCQFALDPDSFSYAVIEVNPRVSRSSALASKATGYPIAKIATKIALGYTLDEIENQVTGKSCACFEPALDYVVVKLPKWPFDKFVSADRTLGTQMKATGEAMAIADTFEAALMKAFRGSEIGAYSLDYPAFHGQDMRARLHICDDLRIFAVFEALRQGISCDEIFEITRIDRFFLHKIQELAEYEDTLRNRPLTNELYEQGKRMGYPDKVIFSISGQTFTPLLPVYKMVDTCAGEFDAQTPYFYSTYLAHCEARERAHTENNRILVLGSGPIRIGQGIEFDYSSVHCARTLRELGYYVVLMNNNPETVSTDFDVSDRLYFEPLTPEDVMGVIKVEQPIGVVVAFGGQTAIKLAKYLDSQGIPILGTSAEGIDLAEDRERFDQLLGKLNIRRPEGLAVTGKEEALAAAKSLGYPVLVRPSYVIGGQNMTIAYHPDDVESYMSLILAQHPENPVLIDKYLSGIELEVDVISDGLDVLIPGLMEHVERTGIHSGDSIAIYPPQHISDKMLAHIEECSIRIAKALGTKGLLNIQYLISQGELFVIEVNPRASRTIPYLSKVTGVPMVDVATRIMVGSSLKEQGYQSGFSPTPPYVSVKVPVFSFEKLSGVNAALGPEMKSTGEVLGIGKTLNEALFKGLSAAGFHLELPRHYEKGGVILTVSDLDKFEIVNLAKKLDDLNLHIYATPGTASAISQLGIDVTVVPPIRESDRIIRLLTEEKIRFVLYTGAGEKQAVDDYIVLHREALLHSVACLTSLDTANALCDILFSRFTAQTTELIDLNRMRRDRLSLPFCKMQSCGNDYIYFDNRDGRISSPESLALIASDRHYGIGGDGIVLIENSLIADAKMRMFNKDGSEGLMAGNSIRCVAKYLYDKGIVPKDHMSIETQSGVRPLSLLIFAGKTGSVTVDMGKAYLTPRLVPVSLPGSKVIDRPAVIGGREYRITCVSMGNPHCVVFCDRVDGVDLAHVGPVFENDPLFPDRVNAEFIRVVNKNTLKMRVWERGNGETYACGTGACAAVVAAVENGYFQKGSDITVKLKGGDLIVQYTDERVLLTGSTELVYEGVLLI